MFYKKRQPCKNEYNDSVACRKEEWITCYQASKMVYTATRPAGQVTWKSTCLAAKPTYPAHHVIFGSINVLFVVQGKQLFSTLHRGMSRIMDPSNCMQSILLTLETNYRLRQSRINRLNMQSWDSYWVWVCSWNRLKIVD